MYYLEQLTFSPVIVGRFPPGVSTPSVGALTLSILRPFSTLTCSDLSDLQTAFQLLALNRRRLRRLVAVMKTIGLDNWILKSVLM